MMNPDISRAVSRNMNNEERLRQIPHEYKINFEPGANHDINNSQISISDQISEHKSDGLDKNKNDSPDNKLPMQGNGETIIIN